ncbi:hypothetical protein [Croceicoccus mobilis]|uniref:Uncharacterized protein n=1 Tax=Croceicoccus mobilis TaxID=1703339 RepID=A0A917DWW4_9SPHN|nr:hypothetical protein [Croceicoccus mobilis]GGD79236.1 hypothetical protein GCM10010990_31390 [Croceicoccus mobilis]
MSVITRYLRLFNPLLAFRDFRDVWEQDTPHRGRNLLMAGAATCAIFSAMAIMGRSQMAAPPVPEITWITQYDAERSDKEIIAENIENQREKEELFALRDAQRAEMRRTYEVIGNATGVDTSDAKAEGEAERAEYERKLAKARAEAVARYGTIDPETGAIIMPTAPEGAGDGN